jgi:LPXTG-motif cell wall-anchored protein
VTVPGVGITRALVLSFVDGARGDADGGANGSITDPGGPVLGAPVDEPNPTTTTTTTTTTVPSTTSTTAASGPTTTAAPVPTTAAPGPVDDGTLPRTGTGPLPLVLSGLVAIIAGAVVLAGRSQRRRALAGR